MLVLFYFLLQTPLPFIEEIHILEVKGGVTVGKIIQFRPASISVSEHLSSLEVKQEIENIGNDLKDLLQEMDRRKQQHLDAVFTYFQKVKAYNQIINKISNLPTTKRLYGNIDHLKIPISLKDLPLLVPEDYSVIMLYACLAPFDNNL